MSKANKIKHNIIMSVVKFRLFVMSQIYQNYFSTALSIGSYLFCLKMSQSHNISLNSGDIPYHQSCPNCWEKKGVTW